MRRTPALACAVVLAHSALAGPIDPPAGPIIPTYKTLDQIEPRTPIGPDTTPGVPGSYVHEITEPGSYYLTEDVVAALGEDGIRVTTANVTIDLSGFAVLGQGGGSDYGITAPFATATNVVIRNGLLSGWERGINTVGDRSMVDGLQITDCAVGVDVRDSCIIRNCVVENSSNLGMFTGQHCIVDSCIVRGSTNSGIAAGFFSTVRNCATQSNGGSGISTAGSIVIDCTAYSNGGNGISASTSTIVRCNADNNTGNGISAGSASIIRECTSTSNDGSGIAILDGSQVTLCVSSGNGGDGIAARDNCTIERCVVTENGSGIIAGSNCAIRGNTSRLHASGFGIQAIEHCRITDNLCNENAFGISASQYCTVERNTAALNFTGITVGDSCRISDNNAEGNTNNGIEVAGRESLIEGNRLSNNLGTGLQVLSDRNLILNNINRLNTQSFDIAADNRVGFTISPPLSGAISGDSDPDALGAGTTDPWANLAH